MKTKLMIVVGLMIFCIDSSMADDIYRWTDPVTGKILMTTTPPEYLIKEKRAAGKLPNGEVIELIFDPNDPKIRSLIENRRKREAEKVPVVVEQTKPRSATAMEEARAKAEIEAKKNKISAELDKLRAIREKEMEQRAAREKEMEQRAAREKEMEQRAAREIERRKVETLKSDYFILDSFLMIAAYEGDMDTVKYLVDIGVGVNTKSKNGGLTALMAATMSNNAKLVSFLLDKGADVNVKTEDGYTALMMASNQGDIDIVRLLIDEGADVHANNAKGLNALALASKNNHSEIIKILLSKK